MKKTTTLKAFLLSLAMALGVLSPTTMNAQSDNYFRASDDFSGNRFAIDWTIWNSGIGEAPLGGGLLVLGIAGAGYAVARRRRSLKKGAAMLAALAMMLGFTQCRKNLETIATAPANGVYITLDVDGGSRVVVNPNGGTNPDGTPFATVTFEKGDIIYVGNNGECVGYLTYDDKIKKFKGKLFDLGKPLNENDYLHFYFMGNKGGTIEPKSVYITDQTSKYPVISYGHSKYFYKNEQENYTATLENYCSIMKFPIADDGTDKQVTLSGMYNKVTVNFAANNANNGAASVNPYTYSKDGFGDIMLHSESNTEKWAIVLPQPAGEAKLYADGYKTAIVGFSKIETNKYYNNNITAIALEPGTADNLFSVGANKKVRFSSGNLQATGTTSFMAYKGWTWSFAPDQWSYIGNNTANTNITGNGKLNAAGTVDLFGWSTASTYYGINNSTTYGDYNGDFKDWGKVANIANLDGHNDWRTLTKEEWQYLFNEKNATRKEKHAAATVNNVPGIVLLPDSWVLPAGCEFKPGFNKKEGWNRNKYNGEAWTVMEAAGAMFLPAAGYREGVAVSEAGSVGYYWSSTPSTTYQANCVYLKKDKVQTNQYDYRYYGYSVRLVRQADN